MLKVRAVFVAASLVISPIWAGTPTRDAMPRRLFTPGSDLPVFVSVTDLLTPGGEIDRALLPDYAAARIEEYLRRKPENGCVPLGGLIFDYVNRGGPHGSLSDATRSADLVMVGTVNGLIPGFQGEEAGTLVRLTPASFLKGGKGETEEAYYVFFPVASFSLGGKSFCKTDPSYPELPRVGDGLLLFLRDRGEAAGEYLRLFDPTDLVVLKADSTLDLPARFRSDQALTGLDKAALLQKVRLQ